MSITFPIWLAWLMAAVAFVVLDVSLAGAQFVLVAVAAAALAAAGAAGLGMGFEGQLVAFLVAAAVSVPVAILAMRARQRAQRPLVRDAGWAEDRIATVEEVAGRRLVRLEGDTYPVRLRDGGLPAAGARVRVKALDGITAVVVPEPGAAASKSTENKEAVS